MLEISYPQSFSETTSVFSIVNLNLLQDFGFECSSDNIDYVTTLLAVAISPMIALAVLVAVYCISRWIVKDGVSSTFQSSPNHTAFLYITYFTLPAIATTVFRTFSCQNVDPEDVEEGGDSYMSADYSISCDSDRYRFAQSYASVMIVVYPIGVPMYYFYLLYKSRDYIKSRFEAVGDVAIMSKRDATLRGISVLYASYKPEYWYASHNIVIRA